MERVGIRELRQNLSRYVVRVKGGEAFAVTERGAEVAVLAPSPRHDDDMSFLVTELGATPAALRPEDLPAPIRAPGPPSEQIIDELRAERD
jgi:prevent-host-death family protein